MKKNLFVLFVAASLCPAAEPPAISDVQDRLDDTVPGDAAPAQASLPKQEEHIRRGIVLLATLHDLMCGVQDESSAAAAVAAVMKLSNELNNWSIGFNSMPALSAEEQAAYEKRYLPVIEKLNSRIKTQAERLAAAEYYGCKNLAAAFVQMVTKLNKQ